jgi:hypothetical protein
MDCKPKEQYILNINIHILVFKLPFERQLMQITAIWYKKLQFMFIK